MWRGASSSPSAPGLVLWLLALLGFTVGLDGDCNPIRQIRVISQQPQKLLQGFFFLVVHDGGMYNYKNEETAAQESFLRSSLFLFLGIVKRAHKDEHSADRIDRRNTTKARRTFAVHLTLLWLRTLILIETEQGGCNFGSEVTTD